MTTVLEREIIGQLLLALNKRVRTVPWKRCGYDAPGRLIALLRMKEFHGASLQGLLIQAHHRLDQYEAKPNQNPTRAANP